MGLGVGVIGVGGLGYLQTTVLTEVDGATVVAGADVSPDARDVFEAEVVALTEAAYLADERGEVVNVRELVADARAERLG